MKCPICHGTGIEKIYDKRTNAYLHIPCATCHKTGNINETGHINQTNEEWFCQLPTYKKAIIMANCYDAFNLDQYACNKHVVIEKWLKEIHQ